MDAAAIVPDLMMNVLAATSAGASSTIALPAENRVNITNSSVCVPCMGIPVTLDGDANPQSLDMPVFFGTRASYVLTVFGDGDGKQVTFAERIMGDPCFVDDYQRVVSEWGQISTYDIEPEQLQTIVPLPANMESVLVPYPQLQTVSIAIAKPALTIPAHTARSTKKRKRRDPHKPRGVVSGYNYFQKDMRAQLKKENPSLRASGQESNNQINETVGARWQILTPEEKKPYEELGKKDKQRYNAEMAAYEPSEGYLKDPPNVNAGDKKPSTKRPRTAYHHFMALERSNIRDQMKRQMNFGELSAELGVRWQALRKEQKAKYEDMALQSKREYSAKVTHEQNANVQM
jgi:hypothetical protein